jgi:OOP family OmpA-OmpF porin
MRLAALGLLLLAMPAAAQDKGTFEIGGFVRATKYPASFGRTRTYDVSIDDLFGAGGRIGYFVARNLTVELDGSYSEADLLGNPPAIVPTLGWPIYRDMKYTPFHLQLVYNAPLSEKFAWEIGGGGSYNKSGTPINRKDVGFGGITGLRWRPGRVVNVRLEGTGDIVPKGYLDKSNTFLGAQLGVSLLFGGKGCDHKTDMIGIHPSTATIVPGASQSFTSEATFCGKPDAVTYTLSGPGTIDAMTGRYTAAGEGTATVTAHSTKGKLMSSATVTVRNPPPPPPPPAPAPAPPPPPPPAPAPPPRYNFELNIVHFRFDHADLTQGGIDSVKAVAATLKAHPEVNVDVTGHTDWVGTNAYNMKLSQARAETVRKLLVAEGVADSRISAKWRGEEEPIMDNKTVAGRAANRRTEIKQNN